jgi:hypothetical protein
MKVATSQVVQTTQEVGTLMKTQEVGELKIQEVGTLVTTREVGELKTQEVGTLVRIQEVGEWKLFVPFEKH